MSHSVFQTAQIMLICSLSDCSVFFFFFSCDEGKVIKKKKICFSCSYFILERSRFNLMEKQIKSSPSFQHMEGYDIGKKINHGGEG